MSQDPAYKVERVEDMMACLRSTFPSGDADAMNQVLFSTGGTHGSTRTIEEAYDAMMSLEPESEAVVTVLILKPRLCRLEYGSVTIRSIEEALFLTKLRNTSRAFLRSYGTAP